MDLNFDLDSVQSQKILLTPQLKQVIEVLKMNSQELFEYVEEQLEANPVLETLENDEYAEERDSIGTGGQNSWPIESINKIRENSQNEEDGFDPSDTTIYDSAFKLSLKEHLLFQLYTLNMDSSHISIGEYLIDNIDENGYLTLNLTEVADFFNIHISKVHEVLEKIQDFDPPGICARNLKECLLLQVKQANLTDKIIIDVIKNHLDDLAGGKFSEVTGSMQLDIIKLENAYNYIKTLEPKPGREFCDCNNIKFIIPDVIIKNNKNGFDIQINEDSIPLININEYYRKILHSDVSSEVKRFITSKIDSATWLIRCIEHRKEVILKAAEYIANQEDEFFGMNKKQIKLLDKKCLADNIGMHESIISSSLSGKYIQCIRGIFEMKCFFA